MASMRYRKYVESYDTFMSDLALVMFPSSGRLRSLSVDFGALLLAMQHEEATEERQDSPRVEQQPRSLSRR
jgi:hypothetical protein